MDNTQRNIAITIITLLVVVIILQLLTRFPIQINITKTDCPQIICQAVQCNCNVNIKNDTCKTWTFNNLYYWGNDDNIRWVYYAAKENCTDMPFNHCGWQI